MTRITNTDQIMALLRQQLQRMTKPDMTRRAVRTSGADKNTSSSAVRRISALSHDEDLSDEDFERAFIRALLMDELGEALAEDHRFERVANEVHRIVTQDRKARALLSDAIEQLGRSGG